MMMMAVAVVGVRFGVLDSVGFCELWILGVEISVWANFRVVVGVFFQGCLFVVV